MASLFASLMSVLAAIARPLMLFLVYMGGKKAGAAEVVAEETAKNLELEKEYAQNHTDGSSPDATVDELRSGRF